MKTLLIATLLAALPAALFSAASDAKDRILRVGYFPNVTHAQGVIGSHGTREGHGWFEQRLGAGTTVQWYPFNAGPSAMEAILAGTIDMTYVGPNPALNAFIRSRGREIRVLAGSAEGGAALVFRKAANITAPTQLKGRRLATPQLGNTQDVAARAWLKKQGFSITTTGGDVLVVPTANPDQLSLFQTGKLDAVWTVEPWVSRLEQEAGGVVFIEQPEAVVTILVSSSKALATKQALVETFAAAHSELTAWINTHGEEARSIVRAGLSAEVRRPMSAAIVASSWKRLTFTDKVRQEQFDALVKDAQNVGFLRDAIPLEKLFSRKP
jgi:NitT/TauT family transport system substrate-binding protein